MASVVSAEMVALAELKEVTMPFWGGTSISSAVTSVTQRPGRLHADHVGKPHDQMSRDRQTAQIPALVNMEQFRVQRSAVKCEFKVHYA